VLLGSGISGALSKAFMYSAKISFFLRRDFPRLFSMTACFKLSVAASKIALFFSAVVLVSLFS